MSRSFVSWMVVACAAAYAVASCAAPEEARFLPPPLALPDDPAGYGPIQTYEDMAVPADNPITAAKASLGWQLYYDRRISGDGSRSCYDCHRCENGLTDGLPTAVGAFGKRLSRSSPTMWNVGYQSQFYWDGRAPSLEKQAFAAWKGGNMGANPSQVCAQLNAIPGYARQFEAVFGEPATPDNVPMALATYVRTLISNDTAFDRWQRGDEGAVGVAAKRGYEVFQQVGCADCHAGVLFTDQQFHNVGIGMAAEMPDVGRYKVTSTETDKGAFKTPTLRDISRSDPYFHDGSVPTLERAVDLMLAGGLDNPWLDRANLKQHDITARERGDLLAFLRSLNQPCKLRAPPLPADASAGR